MSYIKRLKMELTGASVKYYFMFSIMATAFVCGDDVTLNRTSFPKGFIFGTASSAYQYEGAANEDGRGQSIWDTFTHKHPEMISDRSNGDKAIDSYHRYKDDIKMMKDMGLDAYRFSISWPRILPNGTLSGGINKEGIDYYNKFINKLISEGLQPFVTLFHWDLPQSLEDNYGGFLSANIIKDFQDYAEVCFREFGDRVKHWITLNEPFSFSTGGYAVGFLAPNRCSPNGSIKCRGGDSGREPYIVGHNQLLAHAAAVSVYRNKYKVNQKGMIGITLVSNWMLPYFNSKSSSDAVERALDFMYGWFMDPITQGDYPFNMKALVGSRLPKFTEDQSKMVQGSFDFIGLNYYTSNYVYSVPIRNYVEKTYQTDGFFNQTEVRNGVPIGPQASGASWLYIYPKGIKDLLLYTKTKYNNPIIYITENGVGDKDNGTQSLEQALRDDTRLDYHRQHLYYIHSAIKKGADVRGYFAWSLMDNFEWGFGFTVRFGMNYVAYNDDLKRYPKKSALWFKNFLKR